MALCEMKGCIVSGLGRADWEVPIGTIRKDGFETLKKIAQSGFPYPKLEMRSQHPDAKGPNQYEIIRNENYLRDSYPFMEYWRGCHIEERDIRRSRPLSIDH